MVWPSVFNVGLLERPAFVGFYQDCWQSLGALRAQLDVGAAGRLPASSVVALDVQIDLCTPAEKATWQRLLSGFDPTTGSKAALDTAEPAAPEGSWRFLGFDVADQWGLSALTNCGLDPRVDDVEELRRRWGERLDEHHLFNDRLDAIGFKQLSDRRVPEHAPFFVFGLWLVQTRAG